MVKLAPLTPANVEPVGVSYLQNSLFFEPTAKNANQDTSAKAGSDGNNEDLDEDIEFELEEWEETRRPTEGKNKGKTMRYKKFNYYKALGLKDEWRAQMSKSKRTTRRGF